jgi:hypothetical protein
LYTIEAPAESVNGWVPMELRWEDFKRASWEENADAPFAKANQVTGLAFGLGTTPDAPNKSMVWLDDIALLGTVVANTPPDSEQPAPAQETKPVRNPLLPCTGALILPLSVFAGLSMWKRKQE